ncbi:putative glycerol-3-phosphate dehydrogenase [Lupinus albus]|uniref:glycerol-3-phosphate dehydrogenase n=1 Tax=Lupinus albus TaxID=3870 RepID=A0A6A4R2S9_LUPAL|nr:putative glycerol-3-phosphate dehydrogenase [Lupinus albus]
MICLMFPSGWPLSSDVVVHILICKEFETYAKVIVNAAGPFCDAVRNMADKDARDMICPRSVC